MLLLTFSQWFGPGRKCPPALKIEAETKTVAMFTRLPLQDALARVYSYRCAYNDWSNSYAVEFSLIGVSVVDDVYDEDLLYSLGSGLVESLEQVPSDFEQGEAP